MHTFSIQAHEVANKHSYPMVNLFFLFSTEKLKPVDITKMYGALDLGGGSVQITIPIDGKVTFPRLYHANRN